jgi:hypothetical membrane protein
MATVSVVISTSKQSTLIVRHEHRLAPRSSYLTLLFFLLFFLSFVALSACLREAKFLRFALLVILIVIASLISCGGESSTGSGSTTPTQTVTPTGSYTINFTASGAGISRTIQLKLVVQ